jgi:hypothetical protein
MQHALREGLHERVPIGTPDGRTVLGVEWIGIVFVLDAGAFGNSGYRTRRTIAEIRATLPPQP